MKMLIRVFMEVLMSIADCVDGVGEVVNDNVEGVDG